MQKPLSFKCKNGGYRGRRVYNLNPFNNTEGERERREREREEEF